MGGVSFLRLSVNFQESVKAIIATNQQLYAIMIFYYLGAKNTAAVDTDDDDDDLAPIDSVEVPNKSSIVYIRDFLEKLSDLKTFNETKSAFSSLPVVVRHQLQLEHPQVGRDLLDAVFRWENSFESPGNFFLLFLLVRLGRVLRLSFTFLLKPYFLSFLVPPLPPFAPTLRKRDAAYDHRKYWITVLSLTWCHSYIGQTKAILSNIGSARILQMRKLILSVAIGQRPRNYLSCCCSSCCSSPFASFPL